VSDKEWIRKVQVDAGESSLVVVLGGGRDSHLRVVGNDAVFALDELKPWSIQSDPYGWLPSPYHQLDTGRVVKLEFRRPEETFAVARTDANAPWAWFPETPDKTLDPGKVSAALDALGQISASGLPDNPKAAFEGTEVAWTLDDGTRGTLKIGPEEEFKRPVLTSSQTHAVLASSGPLNPLAEAGVLPWSSAEPPADPSIAPP
jgi:hypothetical protein